MRYKNDLKRLLLFPLLQNAVICFQNKSFGYEVKTHFFEFFSFEIQANFLWLGELYEIVLFRNQDALFLIILVSNSKCTFSTQSASLLFKHRIVDFRTPDGALFHSNYIVEVKTPGPVFWTIGTPLSPQIKTFWFCVTNGTLLIREESFNSMAYIVGFQQIGTLLNM